MVNINIVNYFAKLNLQRIHWVIVADDGSQHPFSNIDVVNSLYNLDEEKGQGVIIALQKFGQDRIKINNFLKQVAKSYCDNRLLIIQSLLKDLKNSKTQEQKEHFYNLINNFGVADIKKSGIYDEWKKITF